MCDWEWAFGIVLKCVDRKSFEILLKWTFCVTRVEYYLLKCSCLYIIILVDTTDYETVYSIISVHINQ